MSCCKTKQHVHTATLESELNIQKRKSEVGEEEEASWGKMTQS